MPTLTEQAQMRPADVDRLARAFYDAKTVEYRVTLADLASQFGSKPKRVIGLSPGIKDALRAEARRNAAATVDTYNGLIAGFMERNGKLPPGKLYPKLAAYMRERAANRSALVERNELATARLDALVSFLRANGVEPEFDFVGKAPKCPTCTALIAGNPHDLGTVVAVGRPHLNCTHVWKPRGVKRTDLNPGALKLVGLLPAGVIGLRTLVERAGGQEQAAKQIRNGAVVVAAAGAVAYQRQKTEKPAKT